MPLDLGRITHLLEQMHRSEDDAGDPIPVGMHLVTDGARGFTWEDAGVSGGLDSDLVLFLDLGLSGSAFTVDWADAPSQYVELDDDTAVTLTGIPATVDGAPIEGRGRLWIETDGTHTVTWPVTVVFEGADPDLSTAGLYYVDFSTFDGGTTFYGAFGSSSVVLSDDTPLIESGSGDAGVSTEASRSDHVHPEFGSSASTPPPILLASDHSTPFAFDDILQNSEGTDFLWASE